MRREHEHHGGQGDALPGEQPDDGGEVVPPQHQHPREEERPAGEIQ